MKVFYNLFIVVAVIIFGNSKCDVSELFPEHRSLPDSKGSIEDQFSILTKQDINSPEDSNANFAVRNDIDLPNLPPFPMLRLAGMDLMEINALINHNGFKPYQQNQGAIPFNQQNDVNSFESQIPNFDSQQNNLNQQYLPQKEDEQPQQNQYTQKYDANGGYDYSKPAKAFPTQQQAVNRFAAPEEPEPTVVSDDGQPEFPVNLNEFAPKEILLNRINDDDTTSDDDTPVDDTPSADTPAEDTPAEDTPTVGTPAVDTPVEDTPAVDTPVEDTPVEDTPKEDAPVNVDTTEDHQEISKDIEELTVSVNNFVSSEKPLKYEEEQKDVNDQDENIETDKNLSVTNLLPIPEEPRPFNVPIANRIQDETEEKPSEDTIELEKSSEVAEETDESFKEPAVVAVPQIETEKEVSVSEQENVAPIDSVDAVTPKSEEKPEFDVEKVFADIVPLNEQVDHDADQPDVPIDNDDNDDNVDVKQNDIENENTALITENDEPLRVRFDEKASVDLDGPVIAQDAVAFLPNSEPSQQPDSESSEPEAKSQPEISTDYQSFQPIVPLQTKEQEVDEEQPQQQLEDENVSIQPIVPLQKQEQNEPKSEENDAFQPIVPLQEQEPNAPKSEENDSFQPIVPLQTQDEVGIQSNDEENASIQPIVPLDTAEGDSEPGQQPEPIDFSAVFKAEDVNNMEDTEVAVKNADDDDVEQQNNVDTQSSLGLRVDVEQESEEEKQTSQFEIPVQPTQNDINNLDVDEPAIVRFQADQVNQSEKSSEEFDGYHYPKPANPIVLPPRFRGQAAASQQEENQNNGDIPDSFARIDNK